MGVGGAIPFQRDKRANREKRLLMKGEGEKDGGCGWGGEVRCEAAG
jgi:hypothetical protein